MTIRVYLYVPGLTAQGLYVKNPSIHSHEEKRDLKPLRESFPHMDGQRRARVMAEVALRILATLMPQTVGALRFENLLGKTSS